MNGASLTMEVDTGASVSLISENTYRTTWTAAKRPPLQPSDTRLYTYSGELIEVLGAITVTVCYKQQTKQLSLLVVPTDGPALFGRDWLQAIVLDWRQLNRVHNIRNRALQDVLDQVFRPVQRWNGYSTRHYCQNSHSARRPTAFFSHQTSSVCTSRKSHRQTRMTMQGRRYRTSSVFRMGRTDRSCAQERRLHQDLRRLQANN